MNQRAIVHSTMINKMYQNQVSMFFRRKNKILLVFVNKNYIFYFLKYKKL